VSNDGPNNGIAADAPLVTAGSHLLLPRTSWDI
jgi:hypothetical protein